MTAHNEKTPLSLAQYSLRRHIVWSFMLVGLFFGIGSAWLIFTELSGAVITSGRLVVETQIKPIQHLDGGLVDEVHVKDGDRVEAGQLLIKLDDTEAKTEFQINNQRLIEAYILEQRLRAELWEKSDFTLPRQLQHLKDDERIVAMMDDQKKLLDARLNSFQGQQAQLHEQVKQFGNQIKGFDATKNASNQRLALLDEEIAGLETLIEKKLAPASRLLQLNGARAELSGEIGRLDSDISRLKNSISETELQLLQLKDTRSSETLETIQTTRAEIAEYRELSVSLRKRLAQLNVRAPHAGLVHESAIHTQGQVISPGTDLMLIVPEADQLVVEATVKPTDIDQVYKGQETRLRMSGLDSRSTPELVGKISFVSSELVEDPFTRELNYKIKVEIDKSQLARIGEQELLPGMPTDVFVQTTQRTALNYLTQPLVDQIARTFRE